MKKATTKIDCLEDECLGIEKKGKDAEATEVLQHYDYYYESY